MVDKQEKVSGLGETGTTFRIDIVNDNRALIDTAKSMVIDIMGKVVWATDESDEAGSIKGRGYYLTVKVASSELAREVGQRLKDAGIVCK